MSAFIGPFGDVTVRGEDSRDPRGYNDALLIYGHEVTDVQAEMIVEQVNRLIEAGVLVVNMEARYK